MWQAKKPILNSQVLRPLMSWGSAPWLPTAVEVILPRLPLTSPKTYKTKSGRITELIILSKLSHHKFTALCRHLLPLVAHVASQEYRRVAARSSPRSDGAWGEKNAPVVSHHGYVRAAALDPAVPCVQGCLLGYCLDGGGAGTKVHARSARPAPKWWVVQPGVSSGWDLEGPTG